MKKASRTCVIVAGMHRSGTSALSRVLNFVGCDLPSNIMGISSTNETGHWESEVIMNLNDQLLESAGSYWDDCTPCTPGWFISPRADEFRDRCGEAFKSEFGQSKLSVFKDPRICRLLPFWLDIIENQAIQTLIILPIRNPIAVAQSLAKRDLSDPLYNHHLWLRHVLEAEKGSRGKSRFFCNYDDLLESWSSVISKSERVLNFKWPRLSPKSSEEIDQYIVTRHRHHIYTASSVFDDNSLSPWLRDTYQIMLSWIAGGENAADYDKLDQIGAAFDASCTAFARVLHRGKQAQLEVTRLIDEIGQRNQSMGTTAHRINELEAELDVTRQTLVAVTQDLDIQAQTTTVLETSMQSLQNEHAHKVQNLRDNDERLMNIAGELEAARHQQQALRVDLEVARNQAGHLENELGVLKTERPNLIGELEAARHQQQALRDDLEVARNQAGHLENELGVLKTERSSLIDELVLRENDLDGLGTEVQNAQAQLFSAHSKVQERDIALQIANDAVQVSVSELVAMQALLPKIESELATCKLISEGLQQHVHLLLSDVDAQRADRKTDQVVHANLLQVIDQLRSHIIACEQREAHIVQNCQALKDTVAETDSALRQRIAETSDLHDELIAAKIAIEAERGARNAVENEKIRLQDKLPQLENDLLRQNAIVQGLKQHVTLLIGDANAHTAAEAKLNASVQATQKLRGQLDALVRGLAQQKHVFFQRRGAKLRQSSALIKAAGLIDECWYLAVNQDVAQAGVDPAIHYLTAGHIEGRPLGPD